MKVRILGCGTSTGVPKIGNQWGQCDPAEPRNARLRTSIMVESAGKHILVDCGPDLRQQLLSAHVGHLEGVVVTHAHGDHCHGIDELRPVSQAIVEARELGAELSFGQCRTRFVDQPHGGPLSLGLRFDENGFSVAYAIDFSGLTDDMMTLYDGVDVWIADCLTREPHPTHMHLDGVLGAARDLGVSQLYLVHMGNSLDYRTLVAELPDWAAPAYDGLEFVS